MTHIKAGPTGSLSLHARKPGPEAGPPCLAVRGRGTVSKLLEQIHRAYSAETRILIVLDNHSARLSKDTQAYLKTRPNRFGFVFTPRHGSLLNLGVKRFFPFIPFFIPVNRR